MMRTLKTSFFLGLIYSISAFGSGSDIKFETFFNAPGFKLDGSSLAVENEFIRLIEQTVPGSRIRGSLYIFARRSIAIALSRASERGVDVQLVLDGANDRQSKIPGTAVNLLLAGDQENAPLRCSVDKCIHFCKSFFNFKIRDRLVGTSCHGLAINHTKFMLFSELSSGEKDVVAQTSENFEDAQLKMYNDLLVVKNDKKLYLAMTEYWNGLLTDKMKLGVPHHAISGDGPVRAFFFPRIVSGTDPILGILNRVNCAVPGSRIYVLEATFTRAPVAALLSQLSNQGCNVQVITRIDRRQNAPAHSVIKEIKDFTLLLPFRGEAPIENFPVSIHNKTIFIDAGFDKRLEKQKVVLTGSYNLDLPSLRMNDEVLFEVWDDGVFESYLSFWNQIEDDIFADNLLRPIIN